MSILFLLFFFTSIMPEANDCTFDKLIETYADINIDRMDMGALIDFATETLVAYYERMSERELIDHINEMEDKETADDIIGSLYGINPPDCFIVGRDSSQSDYSSIPSRY